MAIFYLCFYIEEVPLFGNQAPVEEHRSQVGEKQDGNYSRQHADGPNWWTLDVDAVLQSASREAEDGWYAELWLSAEHPQEDAHGAAQHGPVTVGDAEEEDADELRQHEGVGEVRAKDPDHQDAVVQEGERSTGQSHDYHGQPDHPLDLLLGRLRPQDALIDVGGEDGGRGQ